MKKVLITVLVIALIIVLLMLSHLIGTGFSKRCDVVMINYSVSEDQTELTFETSVLSSIGFIRGFEDSGGGVKPHYLTFYSTFGGLNSSFGAKHKFTLELGKDDTEIYFNRPDGGFELVLKKNKETNLWECPDKK